MGHESWVMGHQGKIIQTGVFTTLLFKTEAGTGNNINNVACTYGARATYFYGTVGR